jgi:hypothetical protein
MITTTWIGLKGIIKHVSRPGTPTYGSLRKRKIILRVPFLR